MLYKPLDFFYEISAIPRKSGDEQAISDYLVDFAKRRCLVYLRDEALNVCIKKPGTCGHEKYSALILQSHMDMVYETASPQYPYGQPLRIRRDGSRIYAEGTSLGADNGIGMAYALAVLASDDIPHPPLEAVFTVQEEDGLIGASKLNKDWLNGKALINLDNEEERILSAGCAGAFRAVFHLDGKREKITGPRASMLISLDGFEGGHSGLRIAREGGNAIRLLSRILYELWRAFDIRLQTINGGTRMNSIPVRAEASFCTVSSEAERIQQTVMRLKRQYTDELACTDPEFSLTVEPGGGEEIPFDEDSTKNILSALLLLPNGPLGLSKKFPGTVQTSNNIGIVETSDDTVRITVNPRSSVDSQKRFLSDQMNCLANLVSAKLEIDSEYPAWEYNDRSRLRELYVDEYQSRYGKDVEFRLLHGGIESGILKEKYQLTDVISIGPDIYDVHSTDESADLDSMERVWTCLQSILMKWN